MAMLGLNYSAPILRNKGVPVRLIRLDANGEPVTETVVDEETKESYEKPVTDVCHLRITNNILADLEDIYGSMDAFEEALDAKTTPTLRVVFGMCFDNDRTSRVAFGRIYDITEAATATTTAFALASGLDPETAVVMHRKALALAAEQIESRGQAILAQIARMEEEAEKEKAEAEASQASTTSPTSSDATSTPTPSSEPLSSNPSESEPTSAPVETAA